MIQGTANAGIAELKRKKLETAILGTIYLGLVGSTGRSLQWPKARPPSEAVGEGDQAADYIPQLSEEGLLRRGAFELMDGRASLEEIARKLAAEFPKRLSSWQEALSYAGVVSQVFSR